MTVQNLIQRNKSNRGKQLHIWKQAQYSNITCVM